MSLVYNEDELYRASSQYKLWSFSSDELGALRAAAHEAAVQRASNYISASNGETLNGYITSQCLTLEEEVRLVQRYCDQVRQTVDVFKWGINVKATAVQYLKRFYLTNSCMTYPPKEIYKSVLFLASKTEGVHMTLGEFARRIKTEKEDVLAPEYKIIQSLRFTLDVRQPYRGARGCLMELINIAEGTAISMASNRSPSDLKNDLSALPPPSSPPNTPPNFTSAWTPSAPLVDRGQAAYHAAKPILDAPALLSDVYFLFTPPQIYLAALLLADQPLLTFYLSLKLPNAEILEQITGVIRSCAEAMVACARQPVMTKEERATLERKLEACRDPSSRDLVALDKGVKADGGGEEKAAAKARKAEERKKNDDVFGPAM